MSFRDVLRESFIADFSAADFGAKDIIIILGITLILSLYIFIVYRLISRKSFYNKSFNISLAALAMITAAVIITIQSSIVISLGMVGALSIVRFRTAVKDPLDLVFLFWSIAIGIICGVGLYLIAGIVSIGVTILIFVLDMLPVVKVPMILVIQNSHSNMQEKILEAISDKVKYYKVKSQNITNDQLNLVIELRTNNGAKLLQDIYALEGVTYVSLMDHDGEVTY